LLGSFWFERAELPLLSFSPAVCSRHFEPLPFAPINAPEPNLVDDVGYSAILWTDENDRLIAFFDKKHMRLCCRYFFRG